MNGSLLFVTRSGGGGWIATVGMRLVAVVVMVVIVVAGGSSSSMVWFESLVGTRITSTSTSTTSITTGSMTSRTAMVFLGGSCGIETLRWWCTTGLSFPHGGGSFERGCIWWLLRAPQDVLQMLGNGGMHEIVVVVVIMMIIVGSVFHGYQCSSIGISSIATTIGTTRIGMVVVSFLWFGTADTRSAGVGRKRQCGG